MQQEQRRAAENKRHTHHGIHRRQIGMELRKARRVEEPAQQHCETDEKRKCREDDRPAYRSGE
jgi:hypothetical protein